MLNLDTALLSAIVAIILVIVVGWRIMRWAVWWNWLRTRDTSGVVVGVWVVVHGVGVLVVVITVLVASEWDGGPSGAAVWVETAATATAGVDAPDEVLISDRGAV